MATIFSNVDGFMARHKLTSKTSKGFTIMEWVNKVSINHFEANWEVITEHQYKGSRILGSQVLVKIILLDIKLGRILQSYLIGASVTYKSVRYYKHRAQAFDEASYLNAERELKRARIFELQKQDWRPNEFLPEDNY